MRRTKSPLLSCQGLSQWKAKYSFHYSTYQNLKEYTTWESLVKYYLEQNEDYSLGNSTSGSCSKDGQYMYLILLKGEYMQSSTDFLQKVSASHKEHLPSWRILVLFQILGVTRIGLIKLAPENIFWKTCPTSFSQSTECLISALNPNSFQRLLKISSCTSIWFNPCRGRWQFVADMVSLSFLIFKNFPSQVIQELACVWPWLQTLNCSSVLLFHVCWWNIWQSIFFRSTFQRFPQGPEKTPNSSRAGEQTSVVLSFEPIVALCFSHQPWILQDVFLLELSFHFFAFEALLALEICLKFLTFWLRCCFLG